MQFHILSFEGPDAYSRAGGLASRVNGLGQSLSDAGYDVHLWFVGDPDEPGYEQRGSLNLHRWCQWISHYHRAGVYEAEFDKVRDYAGSLPLPLLESAQAGLARRKQITILAEEWQTVGAVLNLDAMLRARNLRHRFRIFWNANNLFGFEHIDWAALSRAATITTVSRYMRHAMQGLGVDPLVIPNGLEPAAFLPTEQGAVRALSSQAGKRIVLAKMARFDPDKRWISSIDIVADLRDRGASPLFLARGGLESHGAQVLAHARRRGLRIAERPAGHGVRGLLEALRNTQEIDMVLLTTHVDAEARRLLFRGASAVLANSGREPFGLVGLEAMAASGIACTGISGEDYVVPGHNAIALQTGTSAEAVKRIEHLMAHPHDARSMRREAATTARKFAWGNVIKRNLLPNIELGFA